MKKVYCLVNKDTGEVIQAAKTRKPLEETLCDIFMQNFTSDMQEAADAHWINMDDPSQEDYQYAYDCWDRNMRWHKQDYEIQKVWLV